MTLQQDYQLSRHCPVCDSPRGLSMADIRFQAFDGSPVAGTFTIVCCSACGFVFNDTTSTQEDFNRYYNENDYYFTAGTISSGGSTSYDEKRFESLASRLLPYISRNDARVFDVGCSKGGLIELLARKGLTCLHGIDMNPACLQHVKEALGFPAELGSALDLPFRDIKADVMIYSHVVEHVIDLQTLVKSACEKLSDEGIIYVEVPDAGNYGKCTNFPYQDLYLEHVNHFDLETLQGLFHRFGFETVAAQEVLVEASPRGNVPCVWGIFRKGQSAAAISSGKIHSSFSTYLSSSASHPLLTAFTNLATQGQPVHLWGISQYAMLLLGQTPLQECNIKSFVDKDEYKRTRLLKGNRIAPPETLVNASADDTVVITALGYENQVLSALAEMKFPGRVLTLEKLMER